MLRVLFRSRRRLRMNDHLSDTVARRCNNRTARFPASKLGSFRENSVDGVPLHALKYLHARQNVLQSVQPGACIVDQRAQILLCCAMERVNARVPLM